MSRITDLMSNAVPNPDYRAMVSGILKKVGEDDPGLCIQCGKCTSGCEAFKLSELEPHRIMALYKVGLLDEVASASVIWTCMSCMKCEERCPQNLSPVDTILGIKNVSIMQGGSVSDGLSAQLNSLMENGYIQAPQVVPTRGGGSVSRDDLGLPPAPKPEDPEKFLNVLMNTMGELLS